MATPTTVNTWPLNGSIQEFDVTFDYLSQTFLKVNLVGPTGLTLLTLGTDYTFVTPTRIRTTLVYGPPNFTTIELRRETSTTDRLVEFQDASILHATDLNTDALQVMHVAEEARNAATETLGVNGDGNLDARNRRIVNLAAPVAPLDAVNKQYFDTASAGAGVARDEAVAAKDLAQRWANGSGIIANGYYSSMTYAVEAQRVQVIASTAATGAEASKVGAEAGRDKAREWAISGVMPEPGYYSARTYALDAYNQAVVANTAAGAASGSASSAAGSATSANNSQVIAGQQAVIAKNEADRAAANAQSVDTAYLRNRANHTGTQDARTTVSGLGSAAFLPAGLGLGELMKVGSFGLGSPGEAPLTNCNKKIGGLYGVLNAGDAPEGSIGQLLVIPYTNDWVMQVYGTSAGSRGTSLWTRSFINGTTWTTWERIVTEKSIEKPLGQGQQWLDLTTGRSAGVTYTNDTGRSIMVSITESGAGSKTLRVNGVAVASCVGENYDSTMSTVVPAGATYMFSGSFLLWSELRS